VFVPEMRVLPARGIRIRLMGGASGFLIKIAEKEGRKRGDLTRFLREIGEIVAIFYDAARSTTPSLAKRVQRSGQCVRVRVRVQRMCAACPASCSHPGVAPRTTTATHVSRGRTL
jgi:hypothetical protein